MLFHGKTAAGCVCSVEAGRPPAGHARLPARLHHRPVELLRQRPAARPPDPVRAPALLGGGGGGGAARERDRGHGGAPDVRRRAAQRRLRRAQPRRQPGAERRVARRGDGRRTVTTTAAAPAADTLLAGRQRELRQRRDRPAPAPRNHDVDARSQHRSVSQSCRHQAAAPVGVAQSLRVLFSGLIGAAKLAVNVCRVNMEP